MRTLLVSMRRQLKDWRRTNSKRGGRKLSSSASWQGETLEVRLALDAAIPHLLFSEGTSSEYAAAYEAALHAAVGETETVETAQFDDANRWYRTATNGSGLVQGAATTLTWSFVRDGGAIAGYAGEAASASNLIGWLDSIVPGGSGSDLTQRPWFSIFSSAFGRLSAVSGVNYVYQAADDGAALGQYEGVLGTRGDVRIGGHYIDGQSGSNILAYNFYPDNGDMVIDTSNTSFFSSSSGGYLGFRNVLMHEAGHGLGLAHVESSDQRFLMEPYIDLNFDGPQFDDVLGMQRGYGDRYEENGGNDAATKATALGSLVAGSPILVGADASDAVVAAADISFVSIDDDSDADFFSFTVGASSVVTLDLKPLGPTYQQGPQGGTQTTFVAASQSDLTLRLWNTAGTTVLATANSTGLGGSEQIVSSALAAGTYYVSVAGAQNAAQLYQLQLSAGAVASPAGITVTPTSGLKTTEAGGTASFSVVLQSQPTAPVVISVASSDTTEGTVNKSSLTFDSTNWNVAQTVTVRGVDDTTRDGNINYTIVLNVASSLDANYAALNPSDVSVTNQDNEKGGGGGGGGGKGGGKPSRISLMSESAEAQLAEVGNLLAGLGARPDVTAFVPPQEAEAAKPQDKPALPERPDAAAWATAVQEFFQSHEKGPAMKHVSDELLDGLLADRPSRR